MPLFNIGEANITPEMGGDSMSYVLVIDTNKKPVDPCHPAKARLLLSSGKAAVFRQLPFTIILEEESHEEPKGHRIKCDPGSKTTGVALVDDTGRVVLALEIEHRGHNISKQLSSRASIRRSRRSRKSRYRPPRFDNRTRPEGWLPPSVESRIANILTFVSRLINYCPVTSMSLEVAKFDTQLMQNPEISGTEYQQGERAGYEVREYLLEKFKRTCVYCKAVNIPLEIDHIVPKSRGGSNRVANLTIACRPCNQKKGNQTADEYGYPQVQKQAKAPLKDAAAMNVIRYVLLKRLQSYNLPIETGTGGQTKYHRTRQGLPKAHWIDAACVGDSTPQKLHIPTIKPLTVKAVGHGSRQMCRVDKYGFPRTSSKKAKIQFGFQTGDIVHAVVPSGGKKGTYHGKVAVRSNGYFNISTSHGVVQGIKHLYCRRIQRSDGYSYTCLPALPLRSKERSFRAVQGDFK